MEMAKSKPKAEVVDAVAERMSLVADALNGAAFSTHRGAFWSKNSLFVFGNDGFAGDKRAQHEVEVAKAWALKKGFAVEGFGTNNTGYTWVLALKSPEPEVDEDSQFEIEDEVENMLGRAWLEACEKYKNERVASAITQ